MPFTVNELSHVHFHTYLGEYFREWSQIQSNLCKIFELSLEILFIFKLFTLTCVCVCVCVCVFGRLLGTFWKFARIGERLSPYVSVCCITMALYLVFWSSWNWFIFISIFFLSHSPPLIFFLFKWLNDHFINYLLNPMKLYASLTQAVHI